MIRDPKDKEENDSKYVHTKQQRLKLYKAKTDRAKKRNGQI